MPKKVKSKKSSYHKAKRHNRNQSLNNTSSNAGKVSGRHKVKNKTRRFKVAQTVTKFGIPILKRKIKAEIP